jgi:putative transposase
MPRTPRIEFEGAIHHVTLRGNRGAAIFADDRDRAFLLRELGTVTRRYGWISLSYCLMTNHAHLVVETPARTLGAGMRQLAGRHAQAFNKRHGTYGHLFQERYGSVVVKNDVQFAQLLRYVALNPVKAGLCGAPSAWPWSSHRSTLEEPHPRIEALLSPWGGSAGTRYARLFDPAGPLAARFGDESPWTARRPLVEVLASCDLDSGMRRARDEGYRLAEIAAAVGLHVTTVSRRTRRGDAS